MTENPADNPENPKPAPRRRGRPPGRKTTAAAEAAPRSAPVLDLPPPPPPPAIIPPPPPVEQPKPLRPAEQRPPQGARTGGNQRNFRNNRGPRREANPLDRGPRRKTENPAQDGEAPKADGQPAQTPQAPQNMQGEENRARQGGQPRRGAANQAQNRGQNRGQGRGQNQNQNQPQNQNQGQGQGQNQNQNQGQNQQRRGRTGRQAQNNHRQNQPNRQPNENRPVNEDGQAANRPQNRGQQQQRRGSDPNRAPRPAQAQGGETAKPPLAAPKLRQPRPERQAGEKGQRKQRSTAANPFIYNKPPPIKTSSGIKALSQDGSYALSWWAARWIAAMENLVDGRRLSRGRSYAKEGQVLAIEEKPGGVQAMVQGSRPKPYRVAIEVIPLSDREWEQVFDVLASQALFAAQLLAGEMPRNIEEAFDAAGTSLFPARLGDLHTDCSCPDWANPCKHVAATHYILAERFNEDPFLLFRLRGRSSEQILAALRERRSASSGDEPLFEEAPQEEAAPAPPLEANLAGFYNLGEPLEDFALSFKTPTIEMPVLKRLGDPNFLGQESLLATMEPVYRAVRQSALEAALGEAREEETAE